MNQFKKLLIITQALLITGHVLAAGDKEFTPNKAEGEWQLSAFTTIKNIIEADAEKFQPISKGSLTGYKYEPTEEEKQLIMLNDKKTKRSVAKKIKESQKRHIATRKSQRKSESEKTEQSVMHENVKLLLKNLKPDTAKTKKILYKKTNREFIKAANAALIKIELLGSYSEKYSESLITPSEAANMRLNVIHDLFHKFYIIKNLNISTPRTTKSLLSKKEKNPLYNDKFVTKTILKYYKPIFDKKIAVMKRFNSKIADFKKSNIVRLTLTNNTEFYRKNSLWLDKYLKIVAIHNKIYPVANQSWADMKSLESKRKLEQKNITKDLDNLDALVKKLISDKTIKMIESLIASGRHALNTHSRNLNTAALNRLYNNCLGICAYFYKEYKSQEISKQTMQLVEIEAINNYCQVEGEKYLKSELMPSKLESKDAGSKIPALKTQAYKNLAFVESVKMALFKLQVLKFRMQQLRNNLKDNDYNKVVLNVYLNAKNFADKLSSPVISEIHEKFFPSEENSDVPTEPEIKEAAKTKIVQSSVKYADKDITNIIKSILQNNDDLAQILLPKALSFTTKLIRRTDTRWFWDLLGGEQESYNSILIDKYLKLVTNQVKNKNAVAGWILMNMTNIPSYSSNNMREWVMLCIKATTINAIK